MKIDASPFIPGIAIGKIRYWWEREASLSDTVVVLRDPTISKVLSLKDRPPAAIIVLGNHRFSHVLIYLYSLGIPTVLADPEGVMSEGSWVLVDGVRGFIEVSTGRLPPRDWNSLAKEVEEAQVLNLVDFIGSVETIDGETISLEASVNDPDSAADASKLGVSKIGLTRSEFCFDGKKNTLTKEDHKLVLEKLLSVTGSCEVGIRLLDLGGGKDFSWVPNVPELNDSLGIRGCRAFWHPELRPLLKTQLEAIKELDGHNRLSLLIPYVTNVAEFREVRHEVTKIIGHGIPIGAMLETPSAVMTASEINKYCDSITIGTNDLMQCFYGASREFPIVGHLIDPYAPSIHKFLGDIAKLQNQSKSYFKICGHFPLMPFAIEILIALGYRCFSVEPLYISQLIGRIKRISIINISNKVNAAILDGNTNSLLSTLKTIL